jgi:hypothetical protein
MSPRTPGIDGADRAEPQDGEARSLPAELLARRRWGGGDRFAGPGARRQPAAVVPEWQLQPGEETLSQAAGGHPMANVVSRYRQGLPELPTRLSSFSLTPLQTKWNQYLEWPAL